MTTRSGFWLRWLQAACVAVQAFGLFMVLSSAGTKALFGWLLLGDSAAIDRFPASAADYIGLLHAVLGAVLFGWGVALFLIVRWLHPHHPEAVRRIVVLSIIAWAVPDTAFSLWSGYWQNAALNAAFVALFVPSLIALRAPRDRG